jgi:hypothetical protein
MRRIVNAVGVGMKRTIPMSVAIAVGSLMLIDFFFDERHINAVGGFFVESAVIIVAFALLLGLLNVLIVHFRRIGRRDEGWPYSIFLVAVAVIVLVAGISGPQTDIVKWVFDNIQVPLQAATFSLLGFYVATAAYRAFRLRSLESIAFIVAAVVVLLGQVPIGRYLGDLLPAAKDWILDVPSTAGVRGIIIGVALGTIATGVRVLVGFDRPYSGEGGSDQ